MYERSRGSTCRIELSRSPPRPRSHPGQHGPDDRRLKKTTGRTSGRRAASRLFVAVDQESGSVTQASFFLGWRGRRGCWLQHELDYHCGSRQARDVATPIVRASSVRSRLQRAHLSKSDHSSRDNVSTRDYYLARWIGGRRTTSIPRQRLPIQIPAVPILTDEVRHHDITWQQGVGRDWLNLCNNQLPLHGAVFSADKGNATTIASTPIRAQHTCPPEPPIVSAKLPRIRTISTPTTFSESPAAPYNSHDEEDRLGAWKREDFRFRQYTTEDSSIHRLDDVEIGQERARRAGRHQGRPQGAKERAMSYPDRLRDSTRGGDYSRR